MKNREYSILKKEIYGKARLKDCFMGNCDNQCTNRIISAHSLQRMGCLSLLESEVNKNKCLYEIAEQQLNETTNLFELSTVGKQTASTFFGFCGKHDESIFKPIEQNPDKIQIFGDDEHCFLLTLRAFAISYHRKKEEANLYSTEDKELQEKIKLFRGNPYLFEMLTGAKKADDEFELYKKILIDLFLNKEYSGLDYFVYELYHTVPIAGCMMTTPPYLFSGKPINTSPHPQHVCSDIITSVIPLKKRTIVIMAAFDSPYGATYLDELFAMSDLELQKALTWHLLTDMENLFMSPKWFDKLPEEQKQEILYIHRIAANPMTDFVKYPPLFPYNFFDKAYAI